MQLIDAPYMVFFLQKYNFLLAYSFSNARVIIIFMFYPIVTSRQSLFCDNIISIGFMKK